MAVNITTLSGNRFIRLPARRDSRTAQADAQLPAGHVFRASAPANTCSSSCAAVRRRRSTAGKLAASCRRCRCHRRVPLPFPSCLPAAQSLPFFNCLTASLSLILPPRTLPACTAAAAQAADSAAGATQLASLAEGQLLRLQLGGEGGTLWAEVIKCKPRQGAVEVRCCGELLRLSRTDTGSSIVAAAAGWSPLLGAPWAKAVPGLAGSLAKLRQLQQEHGSLPSQLIERHGLEAVQPLLTLAAFREQVAAAPGTW